MWKARSLFTSHLAGTILVLFLLAASLGVFWIVSEYRQTQAESTEFKKRYVTLQKGILQREVQRTLQFAQFMRNQTRLRAQERIRERVENAHALATSLYKAYKDTHSQKEIQGMVREALRGIRYDNGRGYFFATRLDGREELFADRPEIEGQNLLDLTDPRGKPVIRDMIRLARTQGHGFISYRWTKPDSRGEDFPKIAYIKYFEPFDWLIGTGEYLDDMEAEIRAEVLRRIQSLKLTKTGYFFVLDYQGNTLLHPDPGLAGTNVANLRDSSGFMLVKKLLEAKDQRAGVFAEYRWHKPDSGRETLKLTYAKAFPDWQWVVATGVHLDEVQARIDQRFADFRQRAKHHVLSILAILLCCSAAAFLVAALFSRRLRGSVTAFSEFFKKSVDTRKEIEEQGVAFSEFQTLARVANRMLVEQKKAREQIETQRAGMESIFRAAPVGIGVMAEDRFLNLNERLQDMTGYREDELSGKRVRLLYPSDSEFERVRRENQSQLEEFGTATVETVWVRKDRTAMDVLLSSAALQPSDGTRAVTFTALDITARKKAEQALRESEERFRDLAELLPAVIFETDAKGRVTFASRSGFSLFGYTEQDLENGLPASRMIAPDERERASRQMKELVAGTPPVPDEFEAIARDGRRFPILLHAAVVLRGGKPAGFRGVVTDLSGIRQAREELSRSQERFRTIFETVQEGVFIKDLSRRLALVNPRFEEMLGVSSEQALGRTLEELVPLDALPEEAETDARVLKGETVEGEFSIRDGKGTRHYQMTKVPMASRNQRIPGIVGVVRDVTDTRKMEEHLRQSQKMEAIGTLAGGIAHDFNNILSAVIGYSEMALADLPGESEAAANLEQVLQAGERAKELVRQILTFSRRKEEERRPVEVGLIVKEALKLLRASLPATVHIRSNVQSTGWVLADPSQLHQIVMNICTNADHAMKENGGELSVSATDEQIGTSEGAPESSLAPGPYVKIVFSDTGPGIPPEIQDRIFEPFFTTKEREEGTGMGLAVVHGIVRGLGGDIFLKSLPGQGTTFTILIPSQEKTEEMETAPETVGAPGSERILLVDDEESLVQVGRMMLERLGYRVAAQTDAREALDFFRKNPDAVDLVITDQTMPHMTGRELAAALMAIRPGLPVIVCTGHSRTLDEEKALKMGIRALIMKPLSMKTLNATLRGILDNEVSGSEA